MPIEVITYLSWFKQIVSQMAARINADGPVVWGVAGSLPRRRRGVQPGEFFANPGKRTQVFSYRRSCPDGVVPVDGSDLSRRGKIVLVEMQKP